MVSVGLKSIRRIRIALTLGTAAALLAGCGGPQSSLAVSPPISLRPHMLSSGSYQIVHRFGRSSRDGSNPASALIDVNGTFYGTTVRGGVYRAGTVFSIAPNGKETVLHSFGRSPDDGALPRAGLVDLNGTLYGTTSAGGAGSGGTVFSIVPSGKETVIHDFQYDGISGATPVAGLVAVKGVLYGTTSEGGTHTCAGLGCGTAFSITTEGILTVLYSFNGQTSDGTDPASSLIDVHGILFGTTAQGGKYGRGTVFTINTNGDETDLYDFGTSPFFDGANPNSALIDVDGTLYGTTVNGGAYQSNGTVYRITAGGREKVIHSFDGTDGGWPYATLIDVRGTLYGTTSEGGTNDVGTVFSMTIGGKETVVHDFGNSGGRNPVAGLVHEGGVLYGTTYGVSSHRSGNVFSLTP